MQQFHKTWWVYWSDSLFVAICSFFCSIIRINAIKIRIHACDVPMPTADCAILMLLLLCVCFYINILSFSFCWTSINKNIQHTCLSTISQFARNSNRTNGNENNIFKNKWNPVEYSKAFENVFIVFSTFSLSFFLLFILFGVQLWLSLWFREQKWIRR